MRSLTGKNLVPVLDLEASNGLERQEAHALDQGMAQ